MKRSARNNNERIKYRYFGYLKDAEGKDEATIDAVAKAVARFEDFTKRRDFKQFHIEQARSFKRFLSEARNPRTDKLLSKSTTYATLMQLKRFFHWLASQPGYRSRIHYPDAEYFNPSIKDARVATARREPRAPTLEQIQQVVVRMPVATNMDLRNRALVAFIAVTGARDRAVTSLKLKHVDLVTGCVHQDAREVATKFAKTFDTYFFPVWDEGRTIVEDWIGHLRSDLVFGGDDPLFPKTRVELDQNRQFVAAGLCREHWNNAGPIRTIFRNAFEFAGLSYFNPHSFRHMLAMLGECMCQSPEEFKAWSQNLGHENVLTTFNSYGPVPGRRQGEIMHALGNPKAEHEFHAVPVG